MVTRYQYKILKKALRNCGFTPINQREVDACKYLFNKKCFMRSRLREYEYEITQAGEVAMKAYFQDISRAGYDVYRIPLLGEALLAVKMLLKYVLGSLGIFS